MASYGQLPILRWTSDATVLFEHWTTSTVLGLTAAMLVAAFVAAMYELLRNFLSLWDNALYPFTIFPRWKVYALLVFRSGMHALNATIGYIQMVLSMTFDLRIFLAIIVGNSLGFFILGPYFRSVAFNRKRKMKKIAVVCHGERLSDCKEQSERKQFLLPANNSDEQDMTRSIPIHRHHEERRSLTLDHPSQLKETVL